MIARICSFEERDGAVVERKIGAARRNVPTTPGSNAIVEHDHTTEKRSRAIAARDNPIPSRNNPIAERNNAISERNVALAGHNVAGAECNVALTGRNFALAERNIAICECNDTCAEHIVATGEHIVAYAELVVVVAERAHACTDGMGAIEARIHAMRDRPDPRESHLRTYQRPPSSVA